MIIGNEVSGKSGEEVTWMHENRIQHGIRSEWLILIIVAIAMLSGLPVQVHAANGSCSGSGTITDPIRIEDYHDLESIRKQVKEGNSFSGKYLQLEEDIHLPADWEGLGALKEGASDTGNGANIMPFSGILDGRSEDGRIRTVTAANGGKPLFGYVRQATIRNLNIAGMNINGCGLIGNYGVDYGPDGSGSGVPTANIQNVTIKSGTTIRGAGFVSGYAAAGNTVNITGCTAEAGVIVGCDKNREKIGSFAGDHNGMIRDCASAATVYGKDFVGGIMGCKSNSMSRTSISGCTFTGQVIANGDFAGGIAGGGYGGTRWGIISAPNAPCLSITDCLVTGSVKANNSVGGILGYETCLQAWDNGAGYLQSDLFTGTVTTVVTGEHAIKGGLVGQVRGIDKYNIINNNFHASTCGTDRGIGGAGYVDTSCGSHETSMKWVSADGTVIPAVYFDTSQGVPVIIGVNDIYAHNLKENHNRVDDPFGSDADTLATAVSTKELDGSATVGNTGRKLVELLNGTSEGGRWIQGAVTPVIATADGGDSGDDPGGGDSGGGSGNDIQVSFTLLGDNSHPGDETAVHTRAAGNLQQWIPKREYAVGSGSSAWDLMQKALTEMGLTWQGSNSSSYGSYYISGIQVPGTSSYLKEKENGPNSGWMYAVNGEEPGVGVSLYTLEDGDAVILFYTDDYTKEQSSQGYDPASIKKGETYEIAAGTCRVTTAATTDAQGTVTWTKSKNTKKAVVPATVRLADGRTYKITAVAAKAFTGKKIHSVVIGKNVKKLAANSLAKSRANKMILKTKKLTKASVKGSLKSSRIKTIDVSVGTKVLNKKYAKKYRKIFTKKNAGKKAAVCP